MITIFELSDTTYYHSRQVYNILDLLGYYGGLAEVVTGFLAFLVGPVAEHSFLMKAIRKLYLIKTKNDHLFAKPTSEKAKNKEKKQRRVTKAF